MKIWKIILAVLTIIVGILLFAESEDVSRMGQLANALGANVSALTLYAGYIVSILYIVISILLFVYINKKDKQGDIIIIILSLVAFVFSFAGPKRFEDLPFLSFCAVLCLITAIISYIINKRNKNRLAEINKQCSHCGARIEDDSRFCSECGKEITKANVCPHCGASVGEGDAFCPNCGKNLSEPIAADNVEQTVEYGEEEESPIKKYLPYILGAIALIVICGGGWWYFNSSKAPQSNNEAAVAEAVDADSVAAEAVEEDFAVDTLASDIPQTNQQMKEHYQEIISKENASFYYLVDISGDGVPELFLKKYSDTSCFIDIYTYHNGRTVKLLGIGGSDDNTYIGDNHLMTLSVGDDYCVWRKYEFKKYEEYSMKEDVVYKGYKEETENFYKEPSLSLISWTDVSSDSEFNKGDYSVPPVVLAE